MLVGRCKDLPKTGRLGAGEEASVLDRRGYWKALLCRSVCFGPGVVGMMCAD
jgi:hypothetical protein